MSGSSVVTIELAGTTVTVAPLWLSRVTFAELVVVIVQVLASRASTTTEVA